MTFATFKSKLSNTNNNPRHLTLVGSRDAENCLDPNLVVTFFDSNNDPIGVFGPDSPTTLNGEDWEYKFDAPNGAVSCQVDLFCGTVLQKSLVNVGFTH